MVLSTSPPSSCSEEVRRRVTGGGALERGGARCECVNEGSAAGTGSGFNLAGSMEPRTSTMVPAWIRPGCCWQRRCWWNSWFVLLISASLASLTWSTSLCLSSSCSAHSTQHIRLCQIRWIRWKIIFLDSRVALTDYWSKVKNTSIIYQT